MQKRSFWFFFKGDKLSFDSIHIILENNSMGNSFQHFFVQIWHYMIKKIIF